MFISHKATFKDYSLVSSLDIVPTVSDLVGIEVAANLRGHSLQPLLEGERLGVPHWRDASITVG